MGAHVASADEVMGVLTYVKMRRIVFVLARYLKRFEEKQIGILMPSLNTTYLLILATLFAGKTPVMLNWTLGQRALSHCRKAAGLKTVLTSRKFLDKLNNADIGDIEESLVFLEDLKLSLKEKLGAFFNPYAGGCEDETAVILFTSGTEALPKGVPLSHKNILSNHRAALEVVEFLSSDVFYGVLPPFHSFGFSVTGLFPILTGIKVYFAPDPTRYHAMARDIDQWRVTLFCSAPTFILGVFKVAKPGELKSLRYIVAGAEKSPQKLFEVVQKEGKELLEGYGITECAPVVTLTRPGRPHVGVGQPLPGIELCLIGEDSEIAISGPNVFAGYLNHEKDPFILQDGKRWYLSGDLGKIAEDGSLILSGRSKRFVKIGGEMISLGGLEEELFKHYDKSLAVVAKEGDKPQIILFATFDVTVGDVNQFLLEKGYGRLYAIAKVVKIDTIPVTGTGKIQYSSLNETL
jgi:long-chain-fatty-acid--[acyl-carrier-protein] ligase